MLINQSGRCQGDITAFLATCDPATFTGKFLTAENTKKDIALVGWNQ